MHTHQSGNGWLDSVESYERAKLFQTLTPVVFFFSDDLCNEACEAFEERWVKLQKDAIGAAFYRVDRYAVEKAAELEGVATTPYFKVLYQDKVAYEGDGSDWTHFRNVVLKAKKTANEGAAETFTTPTEAHDLTEDLATQIAERLGYTV